MGDKLEVGFHRVFGHPGGAVILDSVTHKQKQGVDRNRDHKRKGGRDRWRIVSGRHTLISSSLRNAIVHV